MREIEKSIMANWRDRNSVCLSCRDRIAVSQDSESYSKSYYLWSTCLVMAENGKVRINISSNDDQATRYYGVQGRQKKVVISQTTKARLNLFLDYYGFNPLKLKKGVLSHNGNKLELNSWYYLDLSTKELIKA